MKYMNWKLIKVFLKRKFNYLLLLNNDNKLTRIGL